VASSYALARKHAEAFEELRIVFDFSRAWDPGTYKRQERSVLQFRKDMALLRSVTSAGP
jgi:hypothetical protein